MKVSTALLLLTLAISSCQSSSPVAAVPVAPPPQPISREVTPRLGDECSPEHHFLRRNEAPRFLPAVRVDSIPDFRLNQMEPLRLPQVQAPSWTEPQLKEQPSELLLKSYPTAPNFSSPASPTLPLRIRHPESPSLPQPDLKLALSNPLTADSLRFQPEGAKLRPRSPYCMPGHTSQNFVLYSVHDGLPLHPGVW